MGPGDGVARGGEQHASGDPDECPGEQKEGRSGTRDLTHGGFGVGDGPLLLLTACQCNDAHGQTRTHAAGDESGDRTGYGADRERADNVCGRASPRFRPARTVRQSIVASCGPPLSPVGGRVSAAFRTLYARAGTDQRRRAGSITLRAMYSSVSGRSTFGMLKMA